MTKKLFFASLSVAFFFLLISPHFFYSDPLLAGERDGIRENRDTESTRDRDSIICGQKVPADPREPRGELPSCPPEEPTVSPVPPTVPPVEPTKVPDGDEVGPTATPVLEDIGRGGNGEEEGEVIIGEQQLEERPPIIELSPTSGEEMSVLKIIRFGGLLWLIWLGKSIVVGLPYRKKRT